MKLTEIFVHDHACEQAKLRIWRKLPLSAIYRRLKQALYCALKLGLVCDHPRVAGQKLMYTTSGGNHYWLVVGPNDSWAAEPWVLVTVLHHKETTYGKCFEQITGALARHKDPDTGGIAEHAAE